MSRQKLLVFGCGITLLAVALWFFMTRDRSVSRAVAIQQQLTDKATPLDPSKQKRLAQDLTRMVDKLDRDQLRQLTDQVRAESREMFDRNMAEFAETPESQRAALLDRHLEESEGWRAVYSALRTDAFRVRRGPRRDQNGNANQRPDQARADQRNRERGRRDADRGNRTDGERSRRESSDGEQRREQAAEYWQALRERAEETGIELGRFGRRGRRRN